MYLNLYSSLNKIDKKKRRKDVLFNYIANSKTNYLGSRLLQNFLECKLFVQMNIHISNKVWFVYKNVAKTF
jgi:hypothetical protein